MFQRERPDGRPAQCGEVPADAERCTQVARQGADVGPRRAVDLDVEVDGLPLRRVSTTSNRDTVTARAANSNPRRRGPVRGPGGRRPDGRHRRGHLLDVAGQGADNGVDLLVARTPEAGTVRTTAPCASSVSVATPSRMVAVWDFVVGEQAQELGGPLDPDDQHAGGHRVEGAGVPDAAC